MPFKEKFGKMGLPGCLFVCLLILLLVCFLFNCNQYLSRQDSKEQGSLAGLCKLVLMFYGANKLHVYQIIYASVEFK